MTSISVRPNADSERSDSRRAPEAPVRHGFDRRRMLTVARTDLHQLLVAKDFWVPMVLLGSFFFLIIPAFLLITITSIGEVQAVGQLANAVEALPPEAQSQIQGDDPATRTAYALAVFLLAPIAVIVPLTISTAVGATTIVGERERGTGEFLAHSPAGVREIYAGKLLASLVPGYVTTIVGFGVYSILVNMTVGRGLGGWFFPTAQWWMMILWVLPPFLVGALALVLRLSARVKSTAAAQQASGLVTLPLIMIAYGQSTGVLFGSSKAGLAIGAIAWLLSGLSLWRGIRSLTRSNLLGVADGV